MPPPWQATRRKVFTPGVSSTIRATRSWHSFFSTTGNRPPEIGPPSTGAAVSQASSSSSQQSPLAGAAAPAPASAPDRSGGCFASDGVRVRVRVTRPRPGDAAPPSFPAGSACATLASSVDARCILKKYIAIIAAAKTTNTSMIARWNQPRPNSPPACSPPLGGSRFISRLNQSSATWRGARPSASARCAARPLSNCESPSCSVRDASCITAKSSEGVERASCSSPSDMRAAPAFIRSCASCSTSRRRSGGRSGSAISDG